MQNAPVPADDSPDFTVQSVPASPYFSAGHVNAAVTEFGPDGAWLLTSTIRYGWRAYFDLAVSLVMGGELEPSVPPINGSLRDEYEAVRFLQIQGLTYAAAEQLATLVHAAKRHESGTTKFFDAYGENLNLVNAVEQLTTTTREEVAALFGTEKLGAFIDSIGQSDDPAASETIEIGPFEYPRSDVDQIVKDDLVARVEGMLDTFILNFHQLQALIVPPAAENASQPPASSLRGVDNSFRHGLRVLFHSAAPQPRNFHIVGDFQGEAAMSVYLPNAKGEIEYGSIETSPRSIAHMVDVLRWVSVRIGQFAEAFLGNHTIGTGEPAVVASLLHLGELPDDPNAAG